MGIESPGSLTTIPIARIAAWIARQAELALVDIDLSLPQYRILHLLADGIALPSSLAERLDVRRPSITAVVDGLVARQLVVREPDPVDRRQVTHSITEAGVSAVVAGDRAIEERLQSVAGSLEDDLAAGEAMAALELWGPALLAWHEQRHAAAQAAHAAAHSSHEPQVSA